MEHAPLHIETIVHSGLNVVQVKGEIDLASVDRLEAAIDDLIQAGTDRLIIDLSGVTFLDSTGLRALLQTNTRMNEAGGSLALVLSGGPVERLLDIAGVSGTFTVYPSLEAFPN